MINYFLIEGNISINNKTLLIINFLNFKIKPISEILMLPPRAKTTSALLS
jgi:hypothetical protein